MLIKKAPDILRSEITEKSLYLNRRKFIVSTAGLLAAGLPSLLEASVSKKMNVSKRGVFATDEKQTPHEDASSYVNFYEFSTKKDGVVSKCKYFKTRPWTITVDGLVKKKKVFDIDDLLKKYPFEERVYRLRCVEAWSMVIPWIGFPLAAFLQECDPLPSAKFVEFTTLHDPKRMVGQRGHVLQWPYLEGLRLDEALHPLTIFAVGMYDEVLPMQNGAPLRLVVPWKYGFKSIKSIVRIRFVAEMPMTSWMKANMAEYGFYANVNPDIDHPRWSQNRERRIGEFRKRKTLMFNGYGEQVADLYKGMDLKKHF